MKRRALLAAVGGGVAGLSGCLDVLAYEGDGSEPLESDRPAVDETFVAGAMEPRCPRGEFPPMTERKTLVQGLPADRTVPTVEAFAERELPDQAPVTLRRERPERLGWRGQTYDIAEHYGRGSERYFVGWVGPENGTRALLVMLYESYAELRVFETSPNC